MRTLALSLLTVVLWATAGAALAASPSFAQTVDRLDERKNTRLQVQEFWKSVRGEQVVWTGEVQDVKGGRSSAKVYLANRAKTLYKGFNIILTMDDLERAAALKKGQTIRFRGTIDRYNAKKTGAVIHLDDGQILK